MVPEGIVPGVWDAGVKPHLLELPAVIRTNHPGERRSIEVWKPVAKCLLHLAKEVLAVEEGDRPFDGGFRSH